MPANHSTIEDTGDTHEAQGLLETGGHEDWRRKNVGERNMWCTGFIMTISLTVLLILVMQVAFGIGVSTEQEDQAGAVPKRPQVTCGDSMEIAVARNCSFDLLSFSWLPWECYDHSLTAQFLQYNWTWYRSPSAPGDTGASSLPQQVSQETALLGNETELYVSGEYHIFHCIYMWRKLHRGLEVERLGLEPRSDSGARLDSYTANIGHTHHCTQFLLSFTQDMSNSLGNLGDGQDGSTRTIGYQDLFKIKVVIETKYPTCEI